LTIRQPRSGRSRARAGRVRQCAGRRQAAYRNVIAPPSAFTAHKPHASRAMMHGR